jgi:hypothetical protein
LIAHLGDGVVVLLAERGDLVLVVEVGFVQVAAELGQFGFALLVRLDLGCGGTAGLVQTLAQLFQLALRVRAGTLALAAGLSLGFQFLLEFFGTGLELLDLALELGNQ